MYNWGNALLKKAQLLGQDGGESEGDIDEGGDASLLSLETMRCFRWTLAVDREHAGALLRVGAFALKKKKKN